MHALNLEKNRIVHKKILCIGLVCIDVVTTVDSYVKNGVKIRGKEPHWQRGGNGSNNCTVLSLFNCPCELLASFTKSDSELSEDSFYARFIEDDLKKNNIFYKNSPFHNIPCPVSHVILNKETGSRTIIHSNRGLPEVSFDDFQKLNLEDYCWIHFEGRCDDQAKMMRYIKEWNTKQCQSNKIPISLEIERKIDLHLQSPLADFIFVDKEHANLRGIHKKEDAINNFWYHLHEKATLIFPWGSEGAIYRTGFTGEIQAVPAYPPENVVDTLAAGDTFISSSIFAMSRGFPIHKALDFGCRVAGAKVGTHGFKNFRNVARDIYKKMF